MSFLASHRTRLLTKPLTRNIISWVLHVGPPHPVSHIRPVIYPRPHHKDDDLPAAKSHPYSLQEFYGESVTYQWRMQNQDIDDFSHTFWLDSNTRFESAKHVVLANLPPYISSAEREAALSEFYNKWLLQEAQRQKEYTKEWRRKSSRELLIGFRLWLRLYIVKWSKRLIIITEF